MANPIWEYSLALYADPAVADACIAAQDSCGLDINLALYAGWLATRDLCLTPEHARAADRQVREWRERVIQPLRALRRDWRTLAEAQALRARVADLELDAERAQQDALWALHQQAEPLPAAGIEPVLPANLHCLLQATLDSHAPWRQHHTLLVDAFSRGVDRG